VAKCRRDLSNGLERSTGNTYMNIEVELKILLKVKIILSIQKKIPWWSLYIFHSFSSKTKIDKNNFDACA